MKVLIIGGGGREHALAWKIAQSPLCEELIMAPGNPLCSNFAECVDIEVTDIVGLKSFAKDRKVDLTIVGPEAPLVAGIVDSFQSSGLKIFGPCKAAAQLEGSKSFSKALMKKYHIPTAAYERASSYEKSISIVEESNFPLVIKADGLAEGKGAFVCHDRREADAALHAIFAEKRFGEAGLSCIIEEFLHGEEASLFVLTDGETIMTMMSAQDHKPLLDNDQGPNTGGMGSYCPAPVMTEVIHEKVLKEIVVPTIHALNAEGFPYHGLLYVGLMIDGRNAKVVEYNCRFGDPETQPLMMMLKTDLLPVMNMIAEGKIQEDFKGLEWHEGAAISVVMASGGYPESYPKGLPIQGLERVPRDAQVFAAGVAGTAAAPVTNGGRVLCVCARGDTVREAQQRAYAGVEEIRFDGAVYRTDIGHKALEREEGP